MLNSPYDAANTTARLSSFAEAAVRVLGMAGSVRGVNPEPHHPVKRRKRPIADAPNMAMFNRIKMDVIDMAGKIVLVADHVLPIAALPNSSFALTRAGAAQIASIGH